MRSTSSLHSSLFLALALSFLWANHLRAEAKVLFVGSIDGVPERQLMSGLIAQYWKDTYRSDEVIVSSYGEASPELEKLKDLGHQVLGNVDATNLHTDARFSGHQFDYIVWIGPTNDQNIFRTPELVEAFIRSGRTLLSDKGKVVVVQKMESPFFRKILALPVPLQYLGRIKLLGRQQTKGDSLTGRIDDVAYSPSEKYFQDHSEEFANPSRREAFTTGMEAICRIPHLSWPKGGLGKRELINHIYGFASLFKLLE